MEVRVLGPLEAHRDGVPVHINARMNRALLAILVVARGEAVPTDRIVDLMWGGAPPPKATAALHTKVAPSAPGAAAGARATERGLGHPHVPGGYRIARHDVDSDADRFEGLVERTRGLLATDARRSAALLDEALGRWRGPALAEFADEEFARATVQRLESLRLTAVELRADARLAAGHTASAVDELRPHVPELQRLERQILDHDPALAPARPEPVRPEPVRARPAPAGPLVGRDAEVALLDDAVAEAARGGRLCRAAYRRGRDGRVGAARPPGGSGRGRGRDGPLGRLPRRWGSAVLAGAADGPGPAPYEHCLPNSLMRRWLTETQAARADGRLPRRSTASATTCAGPS